MTELETSQNLPGKMMAIAVSEPGGPEKLVPVELPVPKPGQGEVLVEVAAAGVNRPDIIQRQGFYPAPPGAPETLGLEICGRVVACGPGVTAWQPGDVVTALVGGGGYAEYCCVHETHALPIPADLSLLEAAALPETCFTVWTNVFERAALQAGESLLIHGGTSGIGTTAIQLAKAFGVRVFATAGTAEKCALCEELGAERAIDYNREDFVAIVQEATGGRGADVILDMVGGPYVERNLKLAAPDGRIVSIAFLQGSKVELNLMPVMLKRLTLTGSTLRARSLEEKARLARAVRENVWPLIETGRFRPVIDKVFPLKEAAQAHAYMESGALKGKIVLNMAEGQ